MADGNPTDTLSDEVAAETALGEGTEEALRLTRFAVDRAAIAAFLISREGRLLYVNEQGCRYLGYSREELLSMAIADVDPDYLPSRWEEHWAELKQAGTLNFETIHRRKDGHIFPVEVAANYLEFSGREYNWGFVRDISTRRTAENELKHSLQLTRSILDSMNDSVSLIDVSDFRIKSVNRVFLEEYGYPDEKEVAGRFCFEVTHHRTEVCVPPDDICPLAETLRTGGHSAAEHVHYGRHGEKIYVEVSTSPIMDENGKVVQVVHVTRNITARKIMENELRESEQRFRDIAEQAEEWIWEVDALGRYTYASPVVEKILGYKPEEVLGMYLYDFFHPAIREELTRAAFEVFSRREPFSNFENLNVDRKGRTIIMSTTGLPVLKEGLLVGYRGVDRDITLARQKEEELLISESRFRNLFEQASISMQIFSPEGLTLEVNHAWEVLWGIANEDMKNYNILEDEQLVAKGVLSLIQKGFSGEATEIPVIRYDPEETGLKGNPRWVKVFIYPVMGVGKQVHQVVVMHLDLTEQVRAERAREESENRLAMAQKAGRVGVFDYDLISGRVVWTEEMETIFGLSPGGFEGTYEGWLKLVHPEDRSGLEGRLAEWLKEKAEQVEFEYRFIRRDSKLGWISAGARISYLADSTPARMLGSAVDITERKEMEETIRHQAHHDDLTGLSNRRLFSEILQLELARAKRSHEKLAVLFLDLDRFKEINDTLGHGIGDELLKEVAGRLKNSVRESDTVARIGGDEFLILLSGFSRTENIVTIAGKIIDFFRAPYLINSHRLQVEISIGISIYPDDGADMKTLYSHADTAMYQAKASEGNAYRFYRQPED